MIKVNKLFYFFLTQYCVKEIEDMLSVFLSSYMYRNTRVSLGEFEKAVESLVGSCSHNISHSPKLLA